MSEYASRGRGPDASYPSHRTTYDPPVVQRTPAEHASETITGLARSIDALGSAVTATRSAKDANDLGLWKETKTSLDRGFASATKALHAARARASDAAPEAQQQLATAEAALATHRAAIDGLAEAPRGWDLVSREAELLAIVSAAQRTGGDGDGGAGRGGHRGNAGWDGKEAALKAEIDQLSAADCLVLERRLRKRSPSDPLATALAPGRMPQARFERLVRHLHGAKIVANAMQPRRSVDLATAGDRAVPRDATPDRAEPSTSVAEHAPPAVAPSPAATLLRILEDGGDVETITGLLTTLDATTKRALARRFETHRLGAGDELATRFSRLDRAPRLQIFAVLRAETPAAYPFHAQIQAAFGAHDISEVQSTTSDQAAEHGARAFTRGGAVTFGEEPDLHTAAHEVAHAVVQRAGIGPSSQGAGGDGFEQHADAVADRVTRGESAEELLSSAIARSSPSASTATGIQRKDQVLSAAQYVAKYADHVLGAIDQRVTETPLDAPHARLPWSHARDPHRVISIAIRRYVGVLPDHLLEAASRLARPANLVALLEEAGTHHTAPAWRADVGQIIANALDVPIALSLRRMGARLRAQLDVRDDHVRGSDLVASSVLDAVIADALTEPGVLAPAPRLAGGGHDTGPAALAHGAHEVTFRWLGPRDPSLWRWIEVTSPARATAEDVARTPLDDRDAPNGSQDASQITGTFPYFEIPLARASQIRAAVDAAPTEVRDQLRRGAQPAPSPDALAASTLADEAALAQAPHPTAHDPAAGDSIDRIGLQLTFLRTLVAPWHLPNALWAAEAFVGRRAAELSSDPRKASRWTAVLAGQERLLHAVSSELGKLLVDHAGHATPRVGPVIAVVEAYVHAASVAHLLGLGAGALAEARHQGQMLPLALAEDHVRAAAGAIEGQHADEAELGHAAVGSDDTTLGMERAAAHAANLRLSAARTSDVDPDQLEDLVADADTVAMRAHIHSLQAKILDLEAQATETGLATKRFEGGLPTVHAFGDQLRGAAATWLGELTAAGDVTFGASTDGASIVRRRAARKQRSLETVRTQMDAFGKRTEIGAYFEWAKTEITDQRFKNKVNDFLLQLGIMVVTMQAGTALVSGARGLLEGYELMSELRGAGLAFKLAETTTQAALAVGGQAASGADVGLRDVAENGLAMLLTEAAMRPFAGLFAGSAAVEGEVKTLARRALGGGAHVAHVAIESGVSIGATRAARMVTHGGELDAAATEEVVTQGLSIAAGRIVGHRTAEAHARLEQAAREHAGEHLATLRDRALRLSHRAQANEVPVRAEALALIAAEHDLLVAERAAYADLPAHDKAKAANAAALGATDARFLDVPLQLAGLSPVVDGQVYEGDWATVTTAFKAVSDSGLPINPVWDAATNTWHLHVGERVVAVHVKQAVKAGEHAGSPAGEHAAEQQAGPKPAAPARAAGHAGPDLHTHMMGVLDVDYFVGKLGGGDAVVAFEKIHGLLADPNAQDKAKHAWEVARRTHAALEGHRAAGASKEQLAREAARGIDQMLAAGEETAFDHPYKIRQVIVEALIDPGGGPYRNYTRDTMAALAKQGIGYSEQSVGLEKLDDKFPEDMMHELHREAAAHGRDVDIRFLAMVPTTTLAGKVTPEAVAAAKIKLANILKRGDVIGIDVAAPEKHAFTAEGMANFEELYATVAAAAAERRRPLVLRPHVGEGYNEGKGHEHSDLAHQNLETLITALEKMGYSAARADSDGVIIRFGHATHTTPEQVQRMAKLGVIVEANIGSNVTTRSITNIGEHPLLLNLYYGVRTVLGTDGGGVMGTERAGDYARAQKIIDRFRVGNEPLVINGKEVHFGDLDLETRIRFSVDYIKGIEDAYHKTAVVGDAHDTSRTRKGA